MHLTEWEASLLVDTLKGTMIDENTYPLLGYEIADAIHYERLVATWAPNAEAGQAFIDRLPTVQPGQWLALGDAAERFWHATHADPTASIATLLRRVGLVETNG